MIQQIATILIIADKFIGMSGAEQPTKIRSSQESDELGDFGRFDFCE